MTHEIPKIFSIVQKVAMLYQGKIRIFGSPREVMASNDPVVSSFIRGTDDEVPKEFSEVSGKEQ